MGRLHCLGNHMMQTMGSAIAKVQDGTNVQLYHKALNKYNRQSKISTFIFANLHLALTMLELHL